MRHKVIFLDLDGVLNNAKSKFRAVIYRYGSEFTHRAPPPDDNPPPQCRGDGIDFNRPLPFDDRYNRLDPQCVRELNRITSATGAKIVVSSAWRVGQPTRFHYLKQYLKSEGIAAEIIGRTPDFVLVGVEFGIRGDEIQKWLEEHPTKSFVILDDNDDMAPHMGRLVLTERDSGLTKTDVDRAIQLLQS